jgi:hypothetical protein
MNILYLVPPTFRAKYMRIGPPNPGVCVYSIGIPPDVDARWYRNVTYASIFPRYAVREVENRRIKTQDLVYYRRQDRESFQIRHSVVLGQFKINLLSETRLDGLVFRQFPNKRHYGPLNIFMARGEQVLNVGPILILGDAAGLPRLSQPIDQLELVTLSDHLWNEVFYSAQQKSFKSVNFVKRSLGGPEEPRKLLKDREFIE